MYFANTTAIWKKGEVIDIDLLAWKSQTVKTHLTRSARSLFLKKKGPVRTEPQVVLY